NEQIEFERDEKISGTLLGRYRAAEHAERVRGERQRVALVPAERQDRAAPRGLGIRRGATTLVERHAFRQRNTEALAELEIGAHERGGAEVDHERIALHRKAERDRISAERRLRTA